MCLIGIELDTILEIESHVPRACTVTSRFVHLRIWNGYYVLLISNNI